MTPRLATVKGSHIVSDELCALFTFSSRLTIPSHVNNLICTCFLSLLYLFHMKNGLHVPDDLKKMFLIAPVDLFFFLFFFHEKGSVI